VKTRADKLVKYTEEARDRARRVQAAAMETVEKAARAVDVCREALAVARAERQELNVGGGSEASFQEADAWIRSHEGRVSRAQLALTEAHGVLAAAKKSVEQAMIRVEQMCALRERARDVIRVKEDRAERRAEDERLARRATTK
jgi:hypothetical protein